MKFSTRATYGLRLCFLIGIANDKISLATLVKQTELSAKYLEQILGMLRKGGIIESSRGSNGGYILSRSANLITIREILTALDDNIELDSCVKEGCNDEYCPNRKIFVKLNSEIEKLLTSITLQDMINDYKCH